MLTIVTDPVSTSIRVSSFNPFNASHGCDNPGTFSTKHVGDIGNYSVDSGTPFNLFSSVLMDLAYTNRSIIGRSVILHESYDHCVQPTGAAGTPISQCSTDTPRGTAYVTYRILTPAAVVVT